MPITRHALVLCALLTLTSAAAQAQDAGGPPQGGRRGGQGAGPGQRGGGARGTVTAVSGTTITLKTPTGAIETVITTDNTRIRRDGTAAVVSAVQVGDEVVAMGMPDEANHSVHAMMVMDVSAAKVAEAKANLGKTYIAGRITAINETQLTVKRADNVSQTITLDETTSIHHGGRVNLEAMGLEGMMSMGGGGMGMGGPGMGGGGMEPRGGGNGGNRGGGNATGGQRPPRTPGNDAGEAITLADVKVGDTIAGTGSVKGGAFVPTDLHIMERRGPGGPPPNGGSGAPPLPPQ